MVQRLEAQGFVHRDPDPDDARAVRIGLTEAGRAHLIELRSTLGREVDAHLADLDDADRAVLERAVELLRAMVADPERALARS